MSARRYRVTGMHCASCGLLVDDTLEDLPGIVSSSTDVRANCTVVEGDVNDSVVMAAIAELGYQAVPDGARR